MTASIGYRQPIALLLGMLGFIGCSGKSPDSPPTPTEERLLTIGKAYSRACYRLGRAPKGFAEIKTSFEGDVPADLLRSPTDGEEFVIIWGVDYPKLPPGREDPFTVAAYEKSGVNGKRHVLRFPMGVVIMTNNEFAKAVFPPGHKPAQ